MSDAISCMQITDLKCNWLRNPIGVDTTPRLGWRLARAQRGTSQSAWQIVAASAPEALTESAADLWNSGKVMSDQCVEVMYGGVPLTSRQRAFWKVRVWDQNDCRSDWSAQATLEMGILRREEWCARWIGRVAEEGAMPPDVPPPAPLLRTEFEIDRPVRRGRAYVSGLGFCEFYVNGARCGDDVLAPGFTCYDRTVLYQAHDVTDLLKPGVNAIGVILGNGWFNCYLPDAWNFREASWRATPKLFLQLHLIYDDGQEDVIVSDETWRLTDGPIVRDGLRNGETFDARRAVNDWSTPGFDDSGWAQAAVVRGPGGSLRSQQFPPIRITRTLSPCGLNEVDSGLFVYDFGENIAGWGRLRAQAPAGAEVTLRHSERIDEHGRIDMRNINGLVEGAGFQTDRYVFRGDGVEEWAPRFTYHGFQYVELSGLPEVPSLDNLAADVVHTDLASRGSFVCSNTLLNTIQEFARRSTLANYHGMPTDCPHREKNGWTGDASLSAEQCLYNFDPVAAYRKWLQDFRDVQRPNGAYPAIVPTGGWGFNWGNGPAWDSAGVLIPYYLYLYDGVTVPIEEHYESMRRYVDYLKTMTLADGTLDFGLGDWCPPTGGPAGYACPAAVTSTAYYYVDARTVAQAAAVLGYDEDAEKYQRLAAQVRAAFRRRFIDFDAVRVSGDCQTAYGCTIFQGLLEPDETAEFGKQLVRTVEERGRHIDCGILGAKYVMHALSAIGRADLAYAIATRTDFPSWGHWIEQGATTLWECWDGAGSRNHHMFSDIGAWFYGTLAGIRPDPAAPGFHRVIVAPEPVRDLSRVQAHHDCRYGRISSNWEQDETGFRLAIDIPHNCTAVVHLPGTDPRGMTVNGELLAQSALIHGPMTVADNGRTVANVRSGQYSFICPLRS